MEKKDQQCQLADSAPEGDAATTIEDEVKASGITWVSAPSSGGDVCSFPFRYKEILYYACTNITINGTTSGDLGSPENPVHLCATEKDQDFNPQKMGFCNTNQRCPIQLQRPEEVEGGQKTNLTLSVVEGQTEFKQTYVKSVETEIIVERKFNIPGYTYNLTLVSFNMHDITAPNIIMRWHILCANPIKPADWDLVYPPNIHYGDTFEVMLSVKKDVPLPTKPKLHVYAVVGMPGTVSTAMKRFDHAPFFSMQQSEFTIPFYVKDDKSAASTAEKKRWTFDPNRKPAGWWETLVTEDGLPPPEVMMYQEYEFEFMGMEDINETNGDFANGKSPTTNLLSGSGGTDIGSGESGSEKDYHKLTLCFPTIKFPGSYGFTVTMKNGISDFRYSTDWNLTDPVYYPENITLLLPGGEGYTHNTGKDDTGYCLQFPNGTSILGENNEEKCHEGNSVNVTEEVQYKWQFNWVEIFAKLEGPFEGTLKYVLPEEAPNDTPLLDFVKPKFYLPAAAHPVFELNMYRGTPRMIAYNFSNLDPAGFNPEMCYVDWPPDNLMSPCTWTSCQDQEARYSGFTPKLVWDIRNCKNVTEDTYNVTLGAWNPLDGWMWLDKPFKVEVLERIGPIFIEDFSVITDINETKPFNIRFAKMGVKTCVTVDYGDGSPMLFFGNAYSCKLRYPELTTFKVGYLDSVAKTFDLNYTYTTRGLYDVTVSGFDERGFAEEKLGVTIFRMPCKVPQVWLPENCTSWLREDRIPKNIQSKPYQVASMSILECNQTVETSMLWTAYKVLIKKDPNSQAGLVEELTEIQINETVPTFQSSMIDIPPLALDYGLHKLVFKMEIETGVPDLPLFRTAYTYFNVTASPLVPSFIKGSVSKVTRGWGQIIKLDGSKFSIDPDNPADKQFNYTWFCRRIDGGGEKLENGLEGPEEFDDHFWNDANDNAVEDEGEMYPVYKDFEAQRIPKHRDPMIINPLPGCLGYGAGPLKVNGPRLTFNTSSFVTYAQVYEISMILAKDVRQAMVKVEIDVGVLPAPIVEIECASAGLCFPIPGAIFVNPTSRLAMRSACIAECLGGPLTYKWNLINLPNFEINTMYCDEEKMTTTSTTTTTTTTTSTTTTTLPPAVTIVTSTYTDNSTGIVYTAASSNGSIMVSFDDGDSGGRKKRQIGATYSEGESVSTNTALVRGPLIPDTMPVGCSSVFSGGIIS